MSTPITFPSRLNSMYEPFLMFSAFNWSKLPSTKNTMSKVIDSADTYILPLSKEGFDNLIRNNWEESEGIVNTTSVWEYVKAMFASKGRELTGSVGESFMRQKGMAINDYIALCFNNTDLRTFSFSFDLIPENQKESESIRQIIRGMKHYSLPSYTGNNWQIAYPYFWNIRMVFPQINQVIPVYECAMTSISDSYFADSKVPLRDGSPPLVSLQLEFSELSIPSRERFGLETSTTTTTSDTEINSWIGYHNET